MRQLATLVSFLLGPWGQGFLANVICACVMTSVCMKCCSVGKEDEDISNVHWLFPHVLQPELETGNKGVCVCGVLAVV